MFRVFRQDNTPFTKLMWTAAILQLVFFGVFPVFLLRSPLGLILLFLPLPVLIALPFVLGILLRREFVNDVIPACRRVCNEKEIVSGAMKSLRFMYFRYLLCLFPGILLFLFLIPQPLPRLLSARHFGIPHRNRSFPDGRIRSGVSSRRKGVQPAGRHDRHDAGHLSGADRTCI